MPKMLPAVMKTAELKGLSLSPGQGAKIARRFEKHRTEIETSKNQPLPRLTNAQQALKYCLDYWDEVGELAVSNVMKQNADRRMAHKERITT